MPHRVPTGKANIPVFKEEAKQIKCPNCSRSGYIKKTGNNDLFCEYCMTIIKDNAEEVDKYFKEEYDFLVDFNGLGGDDE